MKRLIVAAALAVSSPAAAGTASDFVRNTIVPGCRSPGPLDATQCKCQVDAITARISQADIARANEPGALAAISAKANVPYITLMCLKGMSPN